MNTKLVLLTVFLISCLNLAEAQQPKKIPLIGYLANNASGTEAQIDAFRLGLRELGRIEGQNIQIEYRYIEGQQDRVPALIAEFMQLKVNTLVLSTLTSIRTAKQVTATTPVVMVINGDPVAGGDEQLGTASRKLITAPESFSPLFITS